MSYGFNFYDSNSYFWHWQEFVSPALSALIPIVGAYLLSRYKTRIDRGAEDRLRIAKQEEANHEGDIKRMLQAHESEMKKQQDKAATELSLNIKDYEAELQRVTMRLQTQFTYISEKRMIALEAFLTTVEEIQSELALINEDLFEDEFLTRYKAIGEKLRKFWQRNRVNRLFLSENLSEKIFKALGALDQLHVNLNDERVIPEGLGVSHIRQSQYRVKFNLTIELDNLLDAIVKEAQSVWGEK